MAINYCWIVEFKTPDGMTHTKPVLAETKWQAETHVYDKNTLIQPNRLEYKATKDKRIKG